MAQVETSRQAFPNVVQMIFPNLFQIIKIFAQVSLGVLKGLLFRGEHLHKPF